MYRLCAHLSPAHIFNHPFTHSSTFTQPFYNTNSIWKPDEKLCFCPPSFTFLWLWSNPMMIVMMITIECWLRLSVRCLFYSFSLVEHLEEKGLSYASIVQNENASITQFLRSASFAGQNGFDFHTFNGQLWCWADTNETMFFFSLLS